MTPFSSDAQLRCTAALSMLSDVSTIFGDKWQYWNQEYHSAQQIFGDTITGMSIRSLIHGKHSTLYMDSVESTFGILQNGQVFSAAVLATSVAATQGTEANEHAVRSVECQGAHSAAPTLSLFMCFCSGAFTTFGLWSAGWATPLFHLCYLG